MRRKDREVTDRNEMIRIMKDCDVCRLALNNDGYPYILPLNFGLIENGDVLELYFHGAIKGTKYDIIAKDNRASFEMDCKHELQSDESRGYCTMMYESVIGQGKVYILEDEDKKKALDLIVAQYHPEGFAYNPAAMARTTVFKLVIESMTGKIKS